MLCSIQKVFYEIKHTMKNYLKIIKGSVCVKIKILNLLEGAKQADGLTVIIDVFRAFSVACNIYIIMVPNKLSLLEI